MPNETVVECMHAHHPLQGAQVPRCLVKRQLTQQISASSSMQPFCLAMEIVDKENALQVAPAASLGDLPWEGNTCMVSQDDDTIVHVCLLAYLPPYVSSH
ncbi:unnamed protein product [Ostreobium quekettii]|uniref:Uncharacterized protein n=1 Tax=Ostreobium quekettii TaxID=121088 RepID=A0A8S1IZT1_9CHLO|nr:unnamed protein product [Ostreobium quekettii]